MNVLIVDDSTIVQDRIEAMINEDTNCKVVGKAPNSLIAKAMVVELNPDIVITDIRMPGGGGFELVEFIKNMNFEVETIVITNYPYVQYRDKAEELGASYFLSKSDDLDKLTLILNSIDTVPKKI